MRALKIASLILLYSCIGSAHKFLSQSKNSCNGSGSYSYGIAFLPCASVYADYQWFYYLYGEHTRNAQQWFEVVDYITTLDPYFNSLYRLSSAVLSVYYGNTYLAITILEKSLHVPDNQLDWRISNYLSYLHKENDPEKTVYYQQRAHYLRALVTV